LSATLKKVDSPPAATAEPRNKGNQSLLEMFQARQANEIVVAFAGPIGSGIQSVINKTRTNLLELGYTRVETIKLSDFLAEARRNKQVEDVSLPANCSSPYRRYRELQQAGRELREQTDNMRILAEYAVQRIVLDREKYKDEDKGDENKQSGESQEKNERVAYLLDQVKRPEEVELLRALYRNLFYLVGVTKPNQQRHKTLEDSGVYEAEIDDLMEIDRNEEGKGGQRLDKTLHLADFFIRNDANLDHRHSVQRFVYLIHGDKSKTPDRLETGMYAAYAAGLRSACLSRQVGAAITNGADEIIATGCNDVPAPFGGLYSTDSAFDARCMHIGDRECFNDREKHKLEQHIGKVIRASLDALMLEKPIEDAWVEKTLQAVYRETRLGSLIEFSRSVHAEMDAIVSLARAGSVGIDQATLYTTTFPCHSCARHIVAAGITEVFYIEPYDKSMAETLHGDAIVFEEPHDAAQKEAQRIDQPRVKFLHFEGVSPRLFATVFRAENRKDKTTGRFIPLVLGTPTKVLPEYLDNYHQFEDAAVAHFLDIVKTLKPKTA
jgi:deoxycytidylate deaminase